MKTRIVNALLAFFGIIAALVLIGSAGDDMTLAQVLIGKGTAAAVLCACILATRKTAPRLWEDNDQNV